MIYVISHNIDLSIRYLSHIRVYLKLRRGCLCFTLGLKKSEEEIYLVWCLKEGYIQRVP